MVCLSATLATEISRKKLGLRHVSWSRLAIWVALVSLVIVSMVSLGMMHSVGTRARGLDVPIGAMTTGGYGGLTMNTPTGDLALVPPQAIAETNQSPKTALVGQLVGQASGDSIADGGVAVALDDRGAGQQWLRLLPVVIILMVLGAVVLACVMVKRTRRQVAQLLRVEQELVVTNQTLERRVGELIADLEQARSAAEQEQQRAGVVLQDANHRIGNSLATVSSLLSLQMLRSPSPVVRDALESAQARVHAIASSNRRLKLGQEFDAVGADEFLDAALEDLANSLGQADKIMLVGQIDPIIISARDATTLGILLGELVSNAIKHAFRRTDGGTITVAFKAVDGVPTLSVKDDGNGLAGGQTGGEGGLGAVVIKQLAGQFGGAPRYEQPEQGGLMVIVPLPGLIGNVHKSS